MTVHGNLVLPKASIALARGMELAHRHPGLQLDKLSLGKDQKEQGQAIDGLIKCTGDSAFLEELHQRRGVALKRLEALRFEGRTAGSMTLHLSRAGALENAGLALHPLYGFAWLPGTGLKGMTRAWAKTVWAKSHPDQEVVRERLERIDVAFGTGAVSGRIVFHDAWPVHWPKLERDIVNLHHRKYYHGKEPPADRDIPMPSYFVAVATGTVFDFALSDLRLTQDGLLEEVTAWMRTALAYKGAGAKTAAGYGRIEPVASDQPSTRTTVPPLLPETRLRHDYELKLVSPAFLAGAQQVKADCDLRPATLRGLLRWWWRTMHAGHLNHGDLAELEAVIWGDTQRGSAVILSVRESDGNADPVSYNKKQVIKQGGLAPPKKDRRVTQGLFYVSYGMGERNSHSHRFYRRPDDTWRVTLTALKASWTVDGDRGGASVDIPADMVMQQAEAALWLLARYGGIGSKSRKGFGSLSDIMMEGIKELDDCAAIGARLRKHCSVESGKGTNTASLEHRIGPVEVETQWRDFWYALDKIGDIYQGFVKTVKPPKRREVLGLPRKDVQDKRYASPALWSLARCADKKYTVRLLCFPSDLSPDGETGHDILTDLANHAHEQLRTKAASKPGAGRQLPKILPPSPNSSALESGQKIRAELIEEKTKKGHWKAKEITTGIEGNIQNSHMIPDDAQAGQEFELIVAIPKRTNAAFLLPTSDVEERLAKSRNRHPKGKKHR